MNLKYVLKSTLSRIFYISFDGHPRSQKLALRRKIHQVHKLFQPGKLSYFLQAAAYYFGEVPLLRLFFNKARHRRLSTVVVEYVIGATDAESRKREIREGSRMVQSNRAVKNAGKGGRKNERVKKVTKVAKGGVKKGVKAAKVAGATARLAARVLNPKNATKMVKDAAKGKGVVLPGSNYIGPGNPMGRKVKSKGDALAKKHDEDYDRYIKAGYSKKKVYAGFSDADKRLMKKSDVTTPEGVATYAGMKAKQLLHKTGITGKKLKEKNVRKRVAKKAAAAAKSKKMKDEL